MKTAAGVQTGTWTVQFTRRPPTAREATSPGPSGHLPRITRLLVLAHTIDGMIRSGAIRDWADTARLAGVTRARMTQIVRLLLPAPETQEGILNLERVTSGSDHVTERTLPDGAAHADWLRQQVPWLRPKH